MYLVDGARGVYSAQLLCHLAQEKGLPLAAALDGSGVSFSQLSDTQGTITHQQELLILHNVMRELGESSGLSLQLAARCRPGDFGVLGFGLMSANTLLEGLMLGIDYFELTYALAHTFMMRTENTMRFYFVADYLPACDAVKSAVVERDMAVVITLASEVLQTPLMCEAVHFAHADNGSASLAAQHFGVAPIYGSTSNHMEIANEWLVKPLPYTNQSTYQACKEECEELLDKRYAHLGWRYRTQRFLRNVDGTQLNMEAAAEKLGVSSRTLRRHLQAERVTFRQLVEELRCKKAQDMLLYTDASVQEVSALVGYEETASFVRAFRRWAGETPGRWRCEQRLARGLPAR